MSDLVPEAKPSKILVLAGIIIVAGALRAAREIFIPVAVATLLSFLLAPLAKRLMKWGLPNVVAVLLSVVLAFSVLGIIGWMVSVQVVNLAEELPRYQDNIRTKIAAVSSADAGPFAGAFEMIGGFREQFEERAKEAAKEKSVDPREPVLVEVQEESPSLVEILTQYGGPLLTPIGMTGVTLVFVIFILLQRSDLRDRLIKLSGGENLNAATEAVDDATRRVTRYLLMQLVVNATYGFPLGIGLYLIGVPNALLWGLLAVLLRFLPFVGPWLAAFFPITLSIAVDPGWTMPLMVIGFIIVLELVSNNLVEPWLYGSTTGISIVALLFAALVWTWIWGPIGLFLSTPLTVCLLVVGKNVPSLSYLNIILGSEPVLAPDARFYQRLLGMDAVALFRLADEELETRTLTEFYDQIAVPALAMAEHDRHAGTLAERRQQFLIETMHDLLEELGGRIEAKELADGKKQTVLCVPAQDEADELTAMMFAQVLTEAGVPAEASGVAETIGNVVDRIRKEQIQIVCLCGIPPAAVAGVRRKCRQLRDRRIRAKVLAGIWDSSKSTTAVERHFASVCPDLVATTFSDALAQLTSLSATGFKEEKISPTRRSESGKFSDVQKLGLEEIPSDELYGTITRKLAAIFKVPVSLVSIVDSDPQFWKAWRGLPQDWVQPSDELRSSGVCSQVLSATEVLVIEDMSKDERFAENRLVKERGIRFYAGAPLRTKNGHAVGSICIVTTEPQSVTDEQKRQLKILADRLVRVAEEEVRKATG